MSDEIKEILEDVKRHLDYVEATKQSSIRDNEMKVMYDYITNLQEENEKLKNLCAKYEEEHNTAFKLWTMKMEEVPTYEEKMIYKSRCEKANKFIDNNSHYYSTNKHGEGFSIDLDDEVFCNTLSNILNGGGEE